MSWRGFNRFFGTTMLVGVGVAAIATEKVVSERGPEVITEPALAILVRLKPLGTVAAARLEGLFEHWRAESEMTPDELPVGTELSNNAGLSAVTIETGGVEGQSGFHDVATDTSSPPDSQAHARCDPEFGGSDVAVLGDRLGLRFFEHGVLSVGPSVDGTLRGETIVFERLDLSGSYEVEASGSVSLPAIGHVDVIGRSLPCIESLVALAASERLRLNGSVSASFASRPPVLVRGVVRAPGAHEYSPGLTVERVLAQAGAIEETQQLSSLQRASLRMREQELDALSASLIVEWAMIDAALAGDVDFAANRDAWNGFAETIGADRVQAEHEVLLTEITQEKAQQGQISDRIDDLIARIAAAQEHLEVAERQHAYLAERHAQLSERMEQGVTTDVRVQETVDRVMAMERTVLERRDSLLQLEAELRLAQHEADVREAERRNRLAIAARDTIKERSAVREQLRTVRAQLSVRVQNDAQEFIVTIERPEFGGVERFSADSATMVRPGDLVIVVSADSLSAPVEMPIAGNVEDFPGNLVTPVSWR